MGTLLTPEQVSEITHLSKAHLAQLRYLGTGPKFLKLTPRTVAYTEEAVTEWIKSSEQSITGTNAA